MLCLNQMIFKFVWKEILSSHWNVTQYPAHQKSVLLLETLLVLFPFSSFKDHSL